MNDSVFIDTNIILYLYSIDEPEKRKIARKLLNEEKVIISTQVFNELANVLIKKMNVSCSDVRSVFYEILQIVHLVSVQYKTIEMALSIAEKYHYSYFDSLMLSSAIEFDCRTIFTEDMHHGQIIDGSLKIVNPFI